MIQLPILIILAICITFAASQNPAISLMYALNKHYYYAVYNTFEAIGNLLLSIILVERYGILGVGFRYHDSYVDN